MAYTKIVFQNSPSTATPLNAENLNHMDDQIALNDQRLTEIETSYVKSFNGRKGEVTPQANDYNMSQITPTNGATVGQIPIVRNDGTTEEPNLTFHMEDVPSSGHVIKDQSGTSLAQEDALQFSDSFLTDDSANGRTVVENIKEVSPADYASTTDEGIIVTDDGDDALIGAVSDDYVEVTGDGIKTYTNLLNELFALVDMTKINQDSVLVEWYGDDDYYPFAIDTIKSNILSFHSISGNSSNFNVFRRTLSASSSTASHNYMENGGYNTYADDSSYQVGNGGKFILYYGNKKATVDLQTTANRCLMSDGNPISDLECDKTSAGTYTLRATVDAQGNVTYSWV